MEKIFTIEEQISNKARPLQYKINGECWECCSHKSTSSSGYPTLHRQGKTQLAHRYIYQMFKGEIPSGLVIRHTCDNKKCINPDHLILGTYRENTQDYMERQYNVDEFMRKVKEAKGEDMAYKFKKDKREEIIEAYKSGMKVNDIIKTLDISRGMLYNILRKENLRRNK